MTTTMEPAAITDDEAERFLTAMATMYDGQQANPSEHITLRCRAAARSAAVEWILSDNPTADPDHADTLNRWYRDLRHTIGHPNIIYNGRRKAEVLARAEAVKWAIQHAPEVPR